MHSFDIELCGVLLSNVLSVFCNESVFRLNCNSIDKLHQKDNK